MSETLQIEGLTFDVRRSARRKTVGLTVGRDASLTAHLPLEVSTGVAAEKIAPKLAWVYEKLSRCGQSRPGVFRRPEFVDGESFYFLGRHYRLKLVDPKPGEKAVTAIRFQGDRLLFRRSQVPVGDQRIAEYYTRAARPYLNDAVARWKAVLGVAPARFVNVMDLGFRWASCSADGTLNFHWRVMQLPTWIIDYVIVHELAHLKVRDHSARFWDEVKRALPNYSAHREWLREKGGDL